MKSRLRLHDVMKFGSLLLVSFMSGYQLHSIQLGKCTSMSIAKSNDSFSLRLKSDETESLVTKTIGINDGTCCADKNLLQKILQKSITAEGASGVDGSDPSITRIQLAQALKWTRKENAMLNNQATEQMADIGRLQQLSLQSSSQSSPSQPVESDSPSETTSPAKSLPPPPSTATATAATISYTCQTGAGASHKDFDKVTGVTLLECYDFCDETLTCIAIDYSASKESCRTFADPNNPRLSPMKDPHFHFSKSTFCMKKNPTTATSIEQRKIELMAKSVNGFSDDASDDVSSNKQDTKCPSAWVRVEPSSDARYESEDKPAPRLDGIKQPKDIKDKFLIEQCQITSMKGKFRVTKKALCNEGSAASFTTDSSVNTYVRTTMGPDEFDFQLEGPELLPLELNKIYLGNCVSIMNYNLFIPGTCS